MGIDLGLDRVAEVGRRMGLLDATLARRVITVAGTNGKGSTVALLEALARAHGLSTASYTSPHLLRYNERLRLDGAEASDAMLIAGFEAVEAARLDGDPVSLSYFEVGTLGALWAIAGIQPDLAILEVGLGGRLDAVNIIDATWRWLPPLPGIIRLTWATTSKASAVRRRVSFAPGDRRSWAARSCPTACAKRLQRSGLRSWL
ncbi:hypothetical protein Q427_16995 [Halomonas sp. BC04]|nr:hypothetical protein Q427_16995 [Halomonas sp. BC04]